MYSKLKIFLVLFVCVAATALGQAEKGRAIVKGKLQNHANNELVTDVQVTIPYLKLLTASDAEGNFFFSQVPYGVHTLVINSVGYKLDSVKINVTKNVVDLGVIEVNPNENAISMQTVQIPTIALESNDVNNDDDGGGSSGQNVSGLLTAGRDPFLNAAAFVFGNYWFKTRGYERNQQQVQINGAPMNDVETNDAFWGQWGGLNDVFRGRSNTYGLQPSEYAFGGINGNVYFDASAANQRKQTRITYSMSNRQYRNRLMVTHSTGLLDNGWSFSMSFSKRWAKEGYVAGTFYDSYSYYAAASKKLNKKHEFNFITFGAPTRRGKAGPSYGEAFNLLQNNYYNPNWGYQNGEKRNAKVAESFQPVFMLNHEYTPSDKTHITTTVAYQYGKSANSTLDWYNAADPRPDYYKYLPNYYLLDDKPNETAANETRTAFLNDPQIKWDNLYQANYANYLPMPNPDGTLSGDTARRSVYVLGNDVDDIKKWIFNTNLQHIVNDHITFSTGVSYITQKTESYREMLDLLGGDYYLNVNSFTERNETGSTIFNQNDLNNPNKIIKVGDKYYYDYNIYFNKAWWWGQATFTYNRVDFFVSANYGFNSFQREGLFRNGIFADGNRSFGKSDVQNFAIYGLKGGLTYKINGRNYLFANLGLSADAPTVDNTYFSVRTRNQTVSNPETRKSYMFEGGYILRSPRVSGRAVGYVTDMKDMIEVQRFFDQSTGSSNTMVDFVMQKMNARFIGMELAVEYKMNSSWTMSAVAALGQAFYTNNPKVTKYNENTTDTLPRLVNAYINDYYLGVGPQSAYTLGLNYRSKKYWYANMNFNVLDRNYIDIAAPRRTAEVVENVTPGSEQWHKILDQEKFASAFTVDLFLGKSFLLSKTFKKLPRNTFLYFNAGVSNLLDNTNVKTGGFENLRFDYSNGFANKYGPKYFYAFGRNFFINLSIKF